MPVDLEAIRKRCEAVCTALTEAAILARYARLDEHGIVPAAVIPKSLEQLEDEWDMAHLWVAQKLPALLAELTTARALLADALAEAGRLRAALEPFAATDAEMAQPAGEADDFTLQYGYFQRARAALEVKPTDDTVQQTTLVYDKTRVKDLLAWNEQSIEAVVQTEHWHSGNAPKLADDTAAVMWLNMPALDGSPPISVSHDSNGATFTVLRPMHSLTLQLDVLETLVEAIKARQTVPGAHKLVHTFTQDGEGKQP